MKWQKAVLAALVAFSAQAATVGPPLTGATVPVNNGPGDQTDPHVYSDIVGYTDTATVPGSTVIRYKNLATGVDQQVPNNVPGSSDYLSDVYGTQIVDWTQAARVSGSGAVETTSAADAPSSSAHESLASLGETGATRLESPTNA